MKDVTGAYLVYQVHPGHAGLVDEVIDWYDSTAADIERTVRPSAAASSTIMWLDEANKTAEFEPVGTHPGYRRLGLGTAMLLHGMHLARAAGATHMTVACRGAPGHPEARRLFCSVGFRELSRDAPLINTKTAG